MAGEARLTARAGATGGAPAAEGLHELRTAGGGRALLHVPPDAVTRGAPRLLVSLHGAGGNPEGAVRPLLPRADAHGVALLAPASAGATWDAIRGGFGPDVAVIDDLLGQALALVPAAPGRVAVGGFSDGASYALGLGLANGDLFRAVVALSPGFVPPAPRRGAPAVFISHGTADTVLPIAITGRRIAPALEAEGLPVRYREFAGPHAVPPEIADEALAWLVAATVGGG